MNQQSMKQIIRELIHPRKGKKKMQIRNYLLNEMSCSLADWERNAIIQYNTSFFLAHLSTSSTFQLHKHEIK